MSDTPRTDAFLRRPHIAWDALWLEFARQLERELAAITAQRDELAEALKRQRENWENLPSGVDYEADENDKSPDDAVAWMGGLAIKDIDETLEKLKGQKP